MRNRDYQKYIERVKLDHSILKTAHEIGIATASANTVDTAPEILSRDDVIKGINSKKKDIISAIEECEELTDNTKRHWKIKLSNIDLFHPGAEEKVQELYDQLEIFYQDLPSDYGGYNTGITLLRSDIGLIQSDLIKLKNLCFDYQTKYGNSKK